MRKKQLELLGSIVEAKNKVDNDLSVLSTDLSISIDYLVSKNLIDSSKQVDEIKDSNLQIVDDLKKELEKLSTSIASFYFDVNAKYKDQFNKIDNENNSSK